MQDEAIKKRVAVIGGGPAGLIAADILSLSGRVIVDLYDQMPTMGRKFLMAGRGGLNLTHSEPKAAFLGRYGAAEDFLAPLINQFPPEALCDWSEALGQPTFIGTSGRVFPKTLKASPLLRSWLSRLRAQGTQFHPSQEWRGWTPEGALYFHGRDGQLSHLTPDATLLALGGASWPRLGSTGGWVRHLAQRGIRIAPLRPANCGFTVEWSGHFRDRFAGHQLKNIALSFADRVVRGELQFTDYGVEGGAVYALSAALRDEIEQKSGADLSVDLCPQWTEAEIALRLSRPRRAQSLSNFLRRALGLSPLAISFLRECFGRDFADGGAPNAKQIKHATIKLTTPQSMMRAISTAGGIARDELDENLMLRKIPGLFAAGEMLDWEAPTGGYLLQACFATGVAGARGMLAWLKAPPR